MYRTPQPAKDGELCSFCRDDKGDPLDLLAEGAKLVYQGVVVDGDWYDDTGIARDWLARTYTALEGKR